MEQNFQDILDTSKYENKFPPRGAATQIKSMLAMQGNSQSGFAVKQITQTYIENAASVLEDFAKVVLKNRASLNLRTENEILGIFNEAFNTVTTEARGCAVSEFGDESFKKLVLTLFNEKSHPMLEHLQRKVRQKDLDFGGTMSSIRITGSPIGNLVLGSVNQSELTATVTEIVKQGSTEAELGNAIQSLIEVIGKMNTNHKTEQAELFDLLKGLLHQIKLPKQEQSRSTIKIIWDRVVLVSQVSNEVVQVVGKVLPSILALLKD